MEVTSIFLFLGDIGGTEILLILFVVLILFGAKRIPELARGLGQGIREFKDASREVKNEFERSVEAKSIEARSAEVKTVDPNPVETKADRQSLEP